MKVFGCLVCGAASVETSKSHFPKKFTWETLPVVWHGSVGDVWSDETVEALSKYAAVTLEKQAGGQAEYPWAKDGGSMRTCQKGFDFSECGCCQEDLFEKNFKKLKAAHPHIMTIAYVNSIIAYPWYRAAQQNAANESLPLRLEDGSFANNIKPNAGETWFAWNFGLEEVRTIFKEQCAGMTRDGIVDGCYIDGCQNVPQPLDSETKAAYIAGKQQALEELQQEVPGMLLCGSGGDTRKGMYGTSIQNWNKHTDQLAVREIPSLMKAVSEGAMYEAKGHVVCTKGVDGDPNNADLQTELAAFLIAAGEYSYYRCGGWGHADAPWYPVYDKKLGKPLSNATLGDDGVWRRSFAAGTDVTFDTNTSVGTIQWGEDKIVTV